ncbi:MAG TPA: FixH family protein [Pseudomonadales bacterium]
MTHTDALQHPPWYRQFWPWFIIGLPAVVVVACIGLVILSFNVADDMVDKGYYEEGLAINTLLGQLETARQAGMQAQLRVAGDQLTLLVDRLPQHDTLVIDFAHPLDQGRDTQLQLQADSRGEYHVQLPVSLQQTEKWYIDIYPQQAQPQWRIKGTAFFPADQLILTP